MRRHTKKLQFADLVSCDFKYPDNVSSNSKSKKYYSIFSKPPSTKRIAQRTHSSIDKHISVKRRLLNDTKTNLTKLQKIANLATQQITGIDPIAEKWRPFPIRESYRDRNSTEGSDY